MNHDEFIWNSSKWRFHQCISSLWQCSNKLIEFLFLGALCGLVASELILDGLNHLTTVFSVILALAFAEFRARASLFEGFFDGYERGFQDAATCNFDYWGETHTEADDGIKLKQVIEEISRNEQNVSEANLEARHAEITTGLSKCLGFGLLWGRPWK